MAGRGKAKQGGAGSPKPRAGRMAATKALGAASGGEPSGPAASAAPVRRSPRTTPATTSTSAQPQQTAPASAAPTRRSPRNKPAATPTSVQPQQTAPASAAPTRKSPRSTPAATPTPAQPQQTAPASAATTRRSPRSTPAATPTSAQPHHRAVTMGRSPVSVATAGRSGPAATAISAHTQHRAVTRNRGMVPPMFYTEKPTRTKPLVIGRDKIPPMYNEKKNLIGPGLAQPPEKQKRKATMTAPGAPPTKKPATGGTVAEQSSTMTRLRSGMPRNTSLPSGSASGGGGQACEDCRRPAERVVHLCSGCIDIRSSCRSCRAPRH